MRSNDELVEYFSKAWGIVETVRAEENLALESKTPFSGILVSASTSQLPEEIIEPLESA